MIEKWLKRKKEAGEEGRGNEESEDWSFRSSKKVQRILRDNIKKEERKKEEEEEAEMEFGSGMWEELIKMKKEIEEYRRKVLNLEKEMEEKKLKKR